MRCLAVVLASLASLASVRSASAEELPAGQLGLTFGARQPLGSLGGQFSVGLVGGIQAGWQPTSTDRRLSLGVDWSLSWGYHWADDASDNAAKLSSREMSLGVKARILAGQAAAPLFLSTGVGAVLLRTSVPVPPDDERSYLGMYWSAGPELYVLGRYLIHFDVRYGPFLDGPGSLTLSLGLAFGA
jgi:hypothetical protein